MSRKDNALGCFGIIAVVAVIIFLLFVVGPAACTDKDGAQRVLRQAGYTNIVITGLRPFAKSKDDAMSTGFRATSPSGETVTGTVTRGFIFKSATIRLD